MKQSEKDDIMERFERGEIDVLVSTTVIEVGVNVPNACVMLIENCERFGLSQLHQLRGRVGRGSDKAYCILMSPLMEKSQPTSDFRKRIDTICKSNSGFVVAEKDLEIRGPGEFFGVRQHGLPELKIANLAEDMEILKMAGMAAEEIVTRGAHDNPEAMARPMHAPVNGEVLDNASAMKSRKPSPGILAIWLIISPRMREQNKPIAIWLIASTMYFLNIFFIYPSDIRFPILF